MLWDRCLSVCLSICLSVYDVGVLWPNGWMDQDESWHEVGLSPCHTVLDGNQLKAPLPKGAQSHNSRSMSVAAKRLDGS